MSIYSLDKVFDGINNNNYSDTDVNETNYKNYLDKYIEITNPDFVAVLSTKSLEPILYQKNFNLVFHESKKGTIQDIIDSFNTNYPNQSKKVMELDLEMLKFVFENPHLIEPKKNLYSVKFNIELIPDKSVSLIRDITVLSKDENGFPYIILAAWFDVTELYGYKEELLVSIKDFSDIKEQNEEKRKELNNHLHKIIAPKIYLTKREKQILDLISIGKTSEQIALMLSISKHTVDTHRQNIIKKNSISNTSAILKDI